MGFREPFGRANASTASFGPPRRGVIELPADRLIEIFGRLLGKIPKRLTPPRSSSARSSPGRELRRPSNIRPDLLRFAASTDERGARLFLALQQAHTGGDHFGDVPKPASRDGLFGELLQFGGQGHSIHGVNIGSGEIAGKESRYG